MEYLDEKILRAKMKCKSWKKWIIVMCVISLVGIVSFVCKGSAMRMKRYLRQAENFHE